MGKNCKIIMFVNIHRSTTTTTIEIDEEFNIIIEIDRQIIMFCFRLVAINEQIYLFVMIISNGKNLIFRKFSSEKFFLDD